MSTFLVKLIDEVRCQITHQESGNELQTDLAPEYGGKGRSFSSTDLVAVALGSCVLTTIDKIIEREGFDPKNIEVNVAKAYTKNKDMIKEIRLDIFYPEKFSDLLLKKLERALSYCPVKRSLNESVKIITTFNC